jgi:hypothetical protein
MLLQTPHNTTEIRNTRYWVLTSYIFTIILLRSHIWHSLAAALVMGDVMMI